MSDTPILTRFPAGHRLAGKLAWSDGERLVPYLAGGDGPTATTDLLEDLRARRTQRYTEWCDATDAQSAVRSAFEARMTGPEATRPTEVEIQAYRDADLAFRADSDQRDEAIEDLDRRIAEQETMVERRAAAAAASAGTHLQHGATPRQYNPGNARDTSYFRDLAIATVEELPPLNAPACSRGEALERLHRHAAENDVEMPKRAAERDRRARAQAREAAGYDVDQPFRRGEVWTPNRRWDSRTERTSPFERRVEPNRTDGQGGFFIPPDWLIDMYIEYLRAHLVVAGLCRQMDLPAGTNSINIPKLKTPTAVGYQVQDNSGVLSQDWTDTSVQANVKTIAGQSTFALQLLEQSPHQIIDQVVMQTLLAAYNTFLDQQVIAGDGLNSGQLASGHIKGLALVTGGWTPRTVTYTDGSPTGQHFISVMGAMASQVARNRFTLDEYKTVVHGRRGFWYQCALDTNGRPLGETSSGGPFNAGAIERDLQPEGLIATLPYLGDSPLYIDDNIPTSATATGVLTGGTNDVALSGLFGDAWLFQGEARTNVYREVLSGALGVRYQMYNYVAMLARYGQSFCVAYGSGFSAPQGAVTSVLF